MNGDFPLDIGVLGCGIAQADGCDPCGGAILCRSWRDAADPALAAVIIATSDGFHVEVSQRALKAEFLRARLVGAAA